MPSFLAISEKKLPTTFQQNFIYSIRDILFNQCHLKIIAWGQDHAQVVSVRCIAVQLDTVQNAVLSWCAQSSTPGEMLRHKPRRSI